MSTARQIFIACMVAGIVLMVAIVDVQRTGAEISPTMLATFKSGTVTSVGSTSIGISGVEYRVKADAEILDHKGLHIELAKVFVRSEAKFHLNKDREIDMMVVMRPQ
jgi:hypothetical protein